MKFRDQINRKMELKSFPPQKIISLVPSITELLFDIDLGDKVVGLTKFCVHPNGAKSSRTVIGGTKKLNVQKIYDLKPDLILANKEENTQEEIELLSNDFPVYVSDVYDFDSAMMMISDIGKITDKAVQANALISTLSELKGNFEDSLLGLSVLYLIWKKPWMSVGRDTFIRNMLDLLGLKNVLDDRKRYPEIDFDEIDQLNPDLIFLSSEPFPFKQKELLEMQTRFPRSQVFLVDGEMFSWYGSRILKSFPYFEIIKQQINR